jgi:hypothetical protein
MAAARTTASYIETLVEPSLSAVVSSAVNLDDEGATPVPSTLHHSHGVVASFLIKIQMQELQILVPVLGHS